MVRTRFVAPEIRDAVSLAEGTLVSGITLPPLEPPIRPIIPGL